MYVNIVYHLEMQFYKVNLRIFKHPRPTPTYFGHPKFRLQLGCFRN